jgi:predicted phosphate transport protein (TIGR00153 family)
LEFTKEVLKEIFKFNLAPREEKFFNLFEESANNLVDIAHALKDMVETWDYVEERAKTISDIEHKGDSITHEIIALLHQSFVTPFDREDIATLAQSMDDVADLVHSAADDMNLYRIDKPTEQSIELAGIILLGTLELKKAVPLLRYRKDLKTMLIHCVEINRLENLADRVYRQALAELFNGDTEAIQVIKWREIYQHLETATDRCEDVANVLEGVALKNA